MATRETRTVLQFHFVSWPDHGVPDYPTAIMSLRRRVRHYYDANKPMVVHCRYFMPLILSCYHRSMKLIYTAC